MSSDEVGYLSKSYIKTYKEKWEMLRKQIHATISSQATKPLEETDVMKFSWDEEVKSVTMSDEEMEAAKERIKKRFNIKK